MNRHETALTSLLNDIIAHDPLSSSIAVGSLASGEYTDSSDMDIVIVTWRFDTLADNIGWIHAHTYTREESVRFDEGTVDGVLCHVSASTPTNYQGHVLTGPVWRWGPSRILYDPSGIAKWGEGCQKKFYQDNPELDAKQAIFHEQYRRWKSDRGFRRDFETQADFVDSIDLSGAAINYTAFTAQSQVAEIQLKKHSTTTRRT